MHNTIPNREDVLGYPFLGERAESHWLLNMEMFYHGIFGRFLASLPACIVVSAAPPKECLFFPLSNATYCYAILPIVFHVDFCLNFVLSAILMKKRFSFWKDLVQMNTLAHDLFRARSTGN